MYQSFSEKIVELEELYDYYFDQYTACKTIEEGVRTALELAGEDGVVLCFGSLYSIGSIRDALLEMQ